MKYQNITLSIPKEVLRRAKHIAIERGTSLSGLLTQMIIRSAEALGSKVIWTLALDTYAWLYAFKNSSRAIPAWLQTVLKVDAFILDDSALSAVFGYHLGFHEPLQYALSP